MLSVAEMKPFVVFLCLMMYATVVFSQESSMNERQIQSSLKGADKIASVELALGAWFSFTYENDGFGFFEKTDDGYSSGMTASWGYAIEPTLAELHMPRWLEFLTAYTYLNNDNNTQYFNSYGIHQGIYTPTDLESEELVEDDRPYAGTLIWEARVHAANARRANSLVLALGVVGPASLSGKSQEAFHDLINVTDPNGWDHQLDNEPVFQVKATHIRPLWLSSLSADTQFDFNSYSMGSLGNLKSGVGTGLTFRIGQYLTETYAGINPTASQSINRLPQFSLNKITWQMQASVYGQYVVNDITINGNTFKESHSADLNHEQVFVNMSILLAWRQWGGIFSMQRGPKELDRNIENTNFGAFSVTYAF